MTKGQILIVLRAINCCSPSAVRQDTNSLTESSVFSVIRGVQEDCRPL